MVTLEQLADLSPNMRKVLRECNGIRVKSKDTYWMTLQGLACRGLVGRKCPPTGDYCLTPLGMQYRDALKERQNDN